MHFKCTNVSFIPHTYCKYRHTYTHTPVNVTMVLLFEIDDNFSNVKVRITANYARCAVVVEHLAPEQTLTTGVEVGVPLSLGYDERKRVV